MATTSPGPRPIRARAAARAAVERRGRHAGEELQLERVRRDDVRERDELIAEGLGDPLAHVDAAPHLADDGIAAEERARTGRPHPRDRVRDHVGRRGVAEIARQDRVAAAEHAAGAEPLDQRRHLGGGDDPPAERAVGRMVREGDGVERPDVVTEALEDGHRGPVSHAPVDDARLDRQDVHGISPAGAVRSVAACGTRSRIPRMGGAWSGRRDAAQ